MSNQFRNPVEISRARALDILNSGNAAQVVDCLLGLAFYEEDAGFVWSAISRFVDAPEPGVRGVAILCVGHMARIHGATPPTWATAAVARALLDSDRFVSGHAHSATSDIKMFRPRT